MKHLTLLLFSFIICSAVVAQRDYYSVTKGKFRDLPTFPFFDDGNRTGIKENHVKTRTWIFHHNHLSAKTVQEFNKQGQTVRVETFLYKANQITTYAYNDHGELTLTETTQGDKTWSTKRTYDEKNRLIATETVNRRGKYSGSKIVYNTDGKIISRQIFKKGREDPDAELIMTYYENGDKKTTTYKKKGKVKYLWNYDCKPEGELLNVKHRDQETICIKEEFDFEGNRVVWNREFDEKGSLIKTKTVFDSDSNQVSREVFDQEDHLLSDWKRKEDGGHIENTYDKKGAVSSTVETSRNNEGHMVKWERSGKHVVTSLISWEGDLKSMEVHMGKHGTTVNEYIYTYF